MVCTTDDYPIFDQPLLERGLVKLPATYRADAPGVLFAGQKMLRYAGCVPGRRCPSGWRRMETGYYVKLVGNSLLMVSQFGQLRDHQFAIERLDHIAEQRQALTFGFQYVPIWAHTRREAMFLADFYNQGFALQLIGCCWKNVS